jgi:ribonuclease HI
MKEPMYLFVDAGTKNNGKPGQSSVIAITDKLGDVIYEKNVGNKTNNQAEALAIATALWWVYRGERKHIFSDSQIAVGWALKGKVRNKKLPRWYHTTAWFMNALLNKTGSIVEWVPRDKNLAGFYLEDKYQV